MVWKAKTAKLTLQTYRLVHQKVTHKSSLSSFRYRNTVGDSKDDELLIDDDVVQTLFKNPTYHLFKLLF